MTERRDELVCRLTEATLALERVLAAEDDWVRHEMDDLPEQVWAVLRAAKALAGDVVDESSRGEVYAGCRWWCI